MFFGTPPGGSAMPVDAGCIGITAESMINTIVESSDEEESPELLPAAETSPSEADSDSSISEFPPSAHTSSSSDSERDGAMDLESDDGVQPVSKRLRTQTPRRSHLALPRRAKCSFEFMGRPLCALLRDSQLSASASLFCSLN